MITELSPKFENVKSYYRKAFVEVLENGFRLISYNTVVAEINDSELKIFNMQSNTTLRHIKEFMQQKGFPKMAKKDLMQFYQD